MNAQISFLDGTLSLIHIPLDLYSHFLQSILQVLLPQSQPLGADGRSPDLEGLEGLTIDNQHGFLNISVTPIECSIVCHSSWSKNVFEPAIKRLPKELAKTVSISKDSYVVLSVISAGMDAGSRVVDLTSPLALAGIPIFFITTYYSDFILVPTKDRQSVVKALLARGFVFSEDESSFKTPGPSSSSSAHSRGPSQSSGNSVDPPSTPPPSSLGELQTRAFDTLRKRNVVPYIEPGLRLVQCSGREDSGISGSYSEQMRRNRSRHNSNSQSGFGGSSGLAGGGSGQDGGWHGGHGTSWVDTVDTKLYTSIISALVSQPRFLSVTLAQDDPPSLLLDKSLLRIFGDSLVGPTADDGNLVPIFLDLVSLPFEATGIVSGVAGRLVQDLQMMESAELSYLSTARAGAVILAHRESERALEILKGGVQ
ncbi:ACT domain-containing protein [Apodospora peruviana]|uniref:ACT domain-containing protein n=1 Tax=Apodospora peruviana TaxID=516989 RepID=A0AAE0MD16_9PEZI|nr:ACT domain-containing protein [Apodospora peruviana]